MIALKFASTALASQSVPSEKYTPYAGAAYDLEMAQKWGLPILDLPLSFLLDTALLPYAWSN